MERERRIAILCMPDSQRGGIAPFIDLARMVRSGEGPEFALPPAISVVPLYDAALPSPPIMTARPTRFVLAEPVYDAIVLPAGYDMSDEVPDPSPAVVDWLHWHYERGAWLCGVGTGVLALAVAGLLDQRHAAAPPRHAAMVRNRFPRIALAHAAGFVESDRILTAAEPASVFPLVTMLAGRIHSNLLAERYRRVCGIREIRSPEANLFPIRRNDDSLVAEARGWIVAHLGKPITIAAVAEHLHVSERTLVRRFQQGMDMSPAAFLKLARMDAAQAMLRRTRYSVEQIAHLVGYRDMGVFRAAFRTHTGLTPRSYRMKQGAALALDDAAADASSDAAQ